MNIDASVAAAIALPGLVSKFRTYSCSGEIIAADGGLILRTQSRCGGGFDILCRGEPGFDKGGKDRHRQITMRGIRRIVNLCRKIGLPRERAEPDAIFNGDAPERPCRHFQFDKHQDRIDEGAGLDLPVEIGARSQAFKPGTGTVDDAVQHILGATIRFVKNGRQRAE